MKKFRQTLQDCELYDLGFVGNPFTFSNRRLGSMKTRARLDTAMANGEWLQKFQKAQIEHFQTVTSDHNLLFIDVLACHRFKRTKCFKFIPMWLRCHEFRNKVEHIWTSVSSNEVGLTTKLGICGNKISQWNKESIGSVKEKLNKLKGNLEDLRKQERTVETVLEEQKISNEFDEWCFRDELIWKQRSRCDWLKEGDKNTKFFS